MLIARSGDERQQTMPKLASLAIECCKVVWLVFQHVILKKEAQLGVVSEVARDEYRDGPGTSD